MSTLDDDLTDVARPPSTAAGGGHATPGDARGLVDVSCLGCGRRFATDVGLCPWCGHASAVALVADRRSEPHTAVRVARPATGPVGLTVAVGATVAAVTFGLLWWVVAGRSSGAAERSTTVATTIDATEADAAPAAPSATATATATPTATATAPDGPTTTGAAGAGADAARVVADYARAITERDWGRARALLPSVTATDADFATLYGTTRSVHVLPLATGATDAGGIQFVHAGQIVVQNVDGVTSSRLLCARYGVDAVAGTITGVTTTALDVLDGEVALDAAAPRLRSCPTV